MNVEPTAIPDVLLISPAVYRDDRGFFMETFHAERYRELGISTTFVQDNYSHSIRDTLRGLHYQLTNPQAKLVSVIRGEIFDVAVDIRRGSPTCGQWVGQRLSGDNHYQLFIPPGFAHGFCVLSEDADVFYKCSDFYDPADDRGVLWSDPGFAIDWPVDTPLLSGKDAALRPFSSIPPDELPSHTL